MLLYILFLGGQLHSNHIIRGTNCKWEHDTQSEFSYILTFYEIRLGHKQYTECWDQVQDNENKFYFLVINILILLKLSATKGNTTLE
jgi:hypothetical protein